MGRTNTKKEEARVGRLKQLPRSERLAKSAVIKKREGRVLDASEKHAMKMHSEYGEIMRLWESLRVSSNPSVNASRSVEELKGSRYEHKYPIVDQLLTLIEPKFESHAKTPRVSRVIQSMIKYGSPDQLERLLKLLSGSFTAHATDAYGQFVVAALIRHAPHSLLDKILALTIPAVPSLVSHRFGISVIHALYSNRLCTAVNRHLLILAVFKDNMAVMKRWGGYPVLEDVLKQETAQRKRLLVRLFELCDKLVSQKGAVEYPFVQRMVYAFVRYGTKDEVKELCDTLRPYLTSLCLTREGAPLASLSFALIEPKKRKDVLRFICEDLGNLSTEKYSAPVIARFFDLVYDAQLLRKYIVNDLEAHITQVINSPFGYQILMHLLTPNAERKARFLLPNWFEHNLFSSSNTKWNQHTWLTHEYKDEVVEICPKNAMNTHLAVLPSIVRRFLHVVADPDAKVNRQHISLISREILNVYKTETMYKKALELSDEELELLARLSPAKEKRTYEECETTNLLTSKNGVEKKRRLDRQPSSTPAVNENENAKKKKKNLMPTNAEKVIKRAKKGDNKNQKQKKVNKPEHV